MNERQLAGIGVLITRARHQSRELAEAIAAHGGNPILFPVIDIVPRPAADIGADAARLGDPDIVIFVSPNAVRHGLDYAESAALSAIGPATAAAIEAAGRTVDIRPASGYDSEHLLAEPLLRDVSDKVVRIIRGQKGRELLAETLRSRGARVDFLPVYARAIPEYTEAELKNLDAEWRAGHINIVSVMSAETLHNLLSLLPGSCRDLLVQTPLVTPAARVIKEALDLLPGIPTKLAQGPQANDMVLAILELGSEAPGKT